MSVSNVTVTNSPEYKSLKGFVVLYTSMWIIILVLLASIYYENEKEKMLSEHRLSMQLVNETYYPNLLYQFFDSNDELPVNLAYRTAVFDSDKKALASYLENENIDFSKYISLDGDYVHFIVRVGPNDVGVKYLVYETKDDGLWWDGMLKDMLLYGTLIFIFITIVGVNLLRLFLRPMRQSIELLDNFIKDTTHELNTPVSVIVANIEGIDLQQLEEKVSKKIRRVDIAARTISNIYNDLTYLVLHNNIAVEDEEINLSRFLCERVDYFKVGIEQKRITFSREVDEDVMITMDRNKLGRLIDNIISNAIKYNRVDGNIHVELKEGVLTVSDTGIGIPPEKISKIFQRYQRANETVGGFGIGLHIVAMIADEYDIDISVDSQLDKGTEIRLKWKLGEVH